MECLRLRESRLLGRSLIFGALGFFLSFSPIWAEVKAPAQPTILAIFPLGGQPGAELQVTLRGHALDGTYALWFDSLDLSARVLDLRTEPLPVSSARKSKSKDSTKEPIQVLKLVFEIPENALLGAHAIRVLTPGGVSNLLDLWVHARPSVMEGDEPHEMPTEAEELGADPPIVYGTIHAKGEVDYYAFEASRGETLGFEVVSSPSMDPALALYQLTGSWFNPDRAKRLAFNDEPIAYPNLSTEAILTHRFETSGKYLVRVSGFLGEGGVDHQYLLRTTPATSGETSWRSRNSEPQRSDLDMWQERTWTRPLQRDRMKILGSRRVASQTAPDTLKIPVIDLDAEADSTSAGPLRVDLPSLLKGTIDPPGDIDRVSFSVETGDKIALEVETPNQTLPLFNPYRKIYDDQGVEVLTNVHSTLNGNNDISKQIQPKTIHSFPRAGRFTLEIRDITSTYGDAYKVLLRPQVPHMGQIHVDEGHLNLVAGRASKLSLVTDQEEGFQGYVVMTVEGLPEGVKAHTATEVEPDRPPAMNRGRQERYVSKSRKATFVFVVDEDAPATRIPVTARILVRPVDEGRLGAAVPVKDLLIMVLKPTQAAPESGTKVARTLE